MKRSLVETKPIFDVPTVKADAGERIRLRRRSIMVDKKLAYGWTTKPMTLRDLETRLQELQHRNPHKFQAYSRQTQSSIETEGANYLLHVIDSEKRILAMIEVLYDGNIAWFERDTGVLFADVRATRRHVTHWQEGDKRYGTGEVPFLREPLLPAELVFEATSCDMNPILIPGQLCGVVVPLYPEDVHNQVVVLNHPERGMIAALTRDEVTFEQLASKRLLEDVSFEHVVGVAHWIGRRPVAS